MNHFEFLKSGKRLCRCSDLVLTLKPWSYPVKGYSGFSNERVMVQTMFGGFSPSVIGYNQGHALVCSQCNKTFLSESGAHSKRVLLSQAKELHLDVQGGGI
jgi:hypothetical protein